MSFAFQMNRVGTAKSFNGIREAYGINHNNNLTMLLNPGHPLLKREPGVNQTVLDVWGNQRSPMHYASDPYYKVHGDMSSINQLLHSQLQNPNSEIYQTLNQQMKGQFDQLVQSSPNLQRAAAQNKRRAPNQFFNMIPNVEGDVPLGVPSAQGSKMPNYMESMEQMEEGQPTMESVKYPSLEVPCGPGGCYMTYDSVSGKKARQGGQASGQFYPGAQTSHGFPEVRLRHVPIAPQPQKTYYPYVDPRQLPTAIDPNTGAPVPIGSPGAMMQGAQDVRFQIPGPEAAVQANRYQNSLF